MDRIESPRRDLDVWKCECGTIIPVGKGDPKPECEYCRRVKENERKDDKLCFSIKNNN